MAIHHMQLGLIGFNVSLDNNEGNSRLNLSANEVADIASVFALSMMNDVAIDYGISINEADKEFFTHNGVDLSTVFLMRIDRNISYLLYQVGVTYQINVKIIYNDYLKRKV